MATTKREGVFQDMAVINYNSNWYGIPFSQIVQVASAQLRYGLNAELSKLIQEGIHIGNVPGVSADDAISDMVLELRQRVDDIGDFVGDLKLLVSQNAAEWTDVLTSTLIP